MTIRILAALAGAIFFSGAPLEAQVSPGPLSKAHHDLDSPLKCYMCHTFGAGKEKMKCLNCHREIFELVKTHEGMHGHVFNRAKGDTDCVRCHSEHYGENFRIYKWETSKEEFDHKETGYPLVGKHAGLKCEQCHNPKHISAADRKRIMVKDLTRTLEGMHTACLTCHEDHHNGQLGTNCQKCHDYNGFKQVKFDHSTTNFPLTGKHQDVECAKCHKPGQTDAKVTQYKGLDFASCSGCHQDPHHGAFAAKCESCHNTNGWKHAQISGGNFDHNKTKFPLIGKHQGLACEKCHKTIDFKKAIAHDKCNDCHQDQHKGQFVSRADHGDCGPCHNENGFKPTTFNETSHKSTKYPLAGKHQGLACAKCHEPAALDTNYHPAYQLCSDCHKDAHAKQFAGEPHLNKCEDCHKVEGFHPSLFTLKQHQTTNFALKGSHAAIACYDCHRKEDAPAGADRKYHFANLACEGCHQDPHNGEFPKVLSASLKKGQSVCESCHETKSWRETKVFDHGTTTFALLGRHRVLGCLDCHRPAAAEAQAGSAEAHPTRSISFKNAPEKCAGCHEDIHAGQFQKGSEVVDCGSCHDPSRWAAALFDHDAASTFSLAGAHENVPCKSCHNQRKEINGRSVVTYRGTPRECAACHK